MMKPIVLILMFVLSFFSFSQIEMPEDKVDWDFSVEQNGCDATIIGKLKIQEGWHIYALDLPEGSFSIPTTFKVQKSKNYELIGKPTGPKVPSKFDKASGEESEEHTSELKSRQNIVYRLL